MVELIAVLGAFAVPLFWIKARAETKRKQLELEARKLLPAGKPEEIDRVLEENKLLRERVENLESIVCSVDFELNQKLARVIDDQRAGLPTGNPPTPAPGTSSQPKPGPLDRTATAHPVTPSTAKSLTTTLEPGQVLAQRYRVQRMLGKGGMGAVYLADDEVLGELVALKVISSAFAADEQAMVARFRREAAAARKVSSPNVIRIHDLGEARPGLLYLSMEYFAGRTLAEVISQRGMVPMKDVQDFLGQIVAGLEAAHAAGVVHRDLKPSNVLVGERGAIKIIDFGLATMMMADGLTATGAILGTPHYMAPEQIRGRPVDARSDIYSLGALAYHLVCGRPPFSGENPIAIGFAHLSEAPPPLRQLRKDVPAMLEGAILAALAKTPEERPSSARAFLDRAAAPSAA
jgi:eukaryotic-like serine/threonine-protein kinase